MAVVETRKLTKVFKRATAGAVVNVDLESREGEFLVLLGPSGSGKTTLLRMIAGLEEPTSGDILIGGKIVNDLTPRERGIAMVFQSYALYPHLSVYNNIVFPLKAQGVPKEKRRLQAEWAAGLLGIQHLFARKPRELSGGERQRVAVARAIVREPSLFLLDEPLSNLDAKIRIQVRAEIRKLQKELGITTVYVTHDQEEALTLSDRIAVFNQGKVLQIGPPKELYERPANRFVADFIGINNLIEGTVQSIDAEHRQLTVKSAFGELSALLDDRLQVGDRCILCIRPENAAFGGEAAAGRNLVNGRIAFAAYLGNAVRYDVELAQGVIFKVDIRDPWHHEQLPMGSAVSLSFRISSTVAIPAE
jgi:ABC-type sugar transport system ATPase subunit